MKKADIAGNIIGALILVGLIAFPVTRDEIHWHWTTAHDTTDHYETYLKWWPQGRHAVAAKLLYDEQGWQEATRDNSPKGFERYLERYPDGRYAATARDKTDGLQWEKAEKTNTVEAYEQYIALRREGGHVADAKEKVEALRWSKATDGGTVKTLQVYLAAYPSGRFAKDAQERIARLRTVQIPFEAARRSGETALERFLEDYPGHVNESAARAILVEIREGRDIVDLIQEKKIEVFAEGSGITTVSLRIRRLVPYTVTMRVPVGTFFVSANPSAQNMVSTADKKLRLDSDNSQLLKVDAACANRPRSIPRSTDSFTIQRSPNQAELAKMIPVLDRARVDNYTRQAAVWMVTDNANYDELGVLLVSFGPVSVPGMGTRAINERETGRAMQILDEAGIDIKRKAVWRDRSRILAKLPAGDVKTWLEQKN